jgi:O-antigen/teichoic acid export membrane protein
VGILQRQSIKSTIYTYLGVLVGFAYTGVLMPNFISQSEIGALNLILAYSLIFGQLGSLGFNSTTVRIFPYFKDQKKGHHGFLMLSILISLAGFIVVGGVYYAIKPWLVSRNIENSPVFATYLYLMLPITLFTIFFNQLDAYARALYFSTIGSFLKEFFQRVLILVVVLLFIFNFLGQHGLFVAYSAALCVPTAFILAFLVLKKEFFLSFDFGFLKKKLVSELVRMCMFGIVTGFGILAIAQIDRLMINYYLGESDTGIYSVAFYFGILVIMPARSVNRIAASIIATSFKENDLKAIKDMYTQTCLYQFMLSLLLFLLLWLNIDDVFTIIPEAYAAGKYVVFFIGLASVISMAGGTSSAIISSSMYYSYSAWFVGIYLLVIVVTNIIFIPAFGIAGASAASAVSTFVYLLLQFVFVYRKWGFQPYNHKYLLLIVVALTVYATAILLPGTQNSLVNILIKSPIIFIMFVSFSYFLKISTDLNLLVDQNITKLTKRK